VVGPRCVGAQGHGLPLRLHGEEEETKGVIIDGDSGWWGCGFRSAMTDNGGNHWCSSVRHFKRGGNGGVGATSLEYGREGHDPFCSGGGLRGEAVRPGNGRRW
jgi:hypothetical protein